MDLSDFRLRLIDNRLNLGLLIGRQVQFRKSKQLEELVQRAGCQTRRPPAQPGALCLERRQSRSE